MKNYKTSITGILTTGVALATFYGWIPQGAGVLIVAFGVALFSLFAKDNDVTGV
jgi:type IV secretory pathway TrbD component